MPRAGLDAARVVAEGVALAEEVGVDSVTLTALAARLGVKVPSLYKHVDGMDALQARIAVHARAQLTAELEAHREGGLLELAVAFRRWALAHPGLYPATLRAPTAGDAEDETIGRRAVETILDVLARLGVTGDRAVDATRTLRATIHGFITLEAAGGFGMPREVESSFQRAITAFEGSLADWPQA